MKTYRNKSPNKRMQSDLAYGQAADTRRYMATKLPFVNYWCLTVVFLSSGIIGIDALAAPPCIPEEQASIAGYVPGRNKRVLAEKREPLETRNEQGEDDGGAYTATLLKYELYQVVIVRQSVDSVSTESPAVVWAAGIKVGDIRSEIDSRIEYAKVSDSKDKAQYVVCSDIGDVYAILQFSSERLASIDVVMDRP